MNDIPVDFIIRYGLPTIRKAIRVDVFASILWLNVLIFPYYGLWMDEGSLQAYQAGVWRRSAGAY